MKQPNDTDVACCIDQQAPSFHSNLENTLQLQRDLQALMQTPEALLTEQQLAYLTTQSLSRLRNDRYLKQGIPFVKLGSSVRYRVADVMGHIRNNTVDTRQQE